MSVPSAGGRVPRAARWRAPLAAAGGLLLLGAAVLASAADPPPFFPAGSPATESVRFQIAIFHLQPPRKDPLQVLRAEVASRHKALKIVDALPEKPAGMSYLSARIEKDVREKYTPPDVDALKYFGRGLSAEQALAVQSAPQVLVLEFGHPQAKAAASLRAAGALAESLARASGGLVWDDETREMFTADAWNQRRVKAWSGDIPDMARHITVHVYESGTLVRAISLGMAKFGLPDLVVDGFSWSRSDSMTRLINLAGQSMAEGGGVGREGRFQVDAKALRHPEVRERVTGSLLEGATARADLTLVAGEWEQGDPVNRLAQIRFDRYPGPDLQARQEKLFISLFGSEDSATQVKHTDAILAASRRAAEKLPALRRAFTAGFQPGEYLLVKAPFPTPSGGNEWMWVEVAKWWGNSIEGPLRNEPVEVPDLHAGQVVRVDQRQVFDYIRRFPDGTEEGNETGRLMR
jgi:hypothetical protein